MKEQNQISMDIVNPKAAGIDIGSRSHFVAIGQKEEHVREFGVYNEDLKAISNWLKENGIQSLFFIFWMHVDIHIRCRTCKIHKTNTSILMH